MSTSIASLGLARWPGFDVDFHCAVVEAASTPGGRALRRGLEQSLFFSEGKPFLLGPPALVRAEMAHGLLRLTRAYHRAVLAVVEASRHDEAVRCVLSIPEELHADLERDVDRANDRIHICRLDLLLGADGGYRVLETNANCPGGFVFSGICNRAWRELLTTQGVDLPEALEHEREGFMAKWLLRVIGGETGVRPDFLPLLREDGGNRLELGTFGEDVRREGIDCEEIDPRELEGVGGGPPRWKGRPVTHAYLKLGMQSFLRMRDDLDPFVDAVRERRLFVQNGQRGRWVGDSKLCLAVISDPRFRHLFDAADWELLREHVPWSRNASLLTRQGAACILGGKDAYVLKKGLDTRGRSVLVGRELTPEAWSAAWRVASAEGWLVQAFHDSTWIERDFEGDGRNRHDLAVGAINGEVVLVLSRSSEELRVNMARTGRMHPVFMAR